MEFGETPEECAIRETQEETGLSISQIKRGPWLNDFFADSQYITLLMVGRYNGGEAEIKEKDKFNTWQWFPCSEPPNPLFLPIQNFLSIGF